MRKKSKVVYPGIETAAIPLPASRPALLGESARIVPKFFLSAREEFAGSIVRFGAVRSRAAYCAWLSRADLVVSTTEHENFGISWLEAMAAGAWPLLPRRERANLARRFSWDRRIDEFDDQFESIVRGR